MDNKLKELHDRRAKACAEFCAGVNTEALEGKWRLAGILNILTATSRYSSGVVKVLTRSVLKQMRGANDPKAN